MPRIGFAFLLVTGVAVGTWVDAIPRRTVNKAGEYWILSADLHVHAFPGDGALAPWTLRHEADVAGVDVFAITNHNQTFTAVFGQRLAFSADAPIVIVGAEITNPRYHLIAVGIRRPIDWRQPAEAAIAAVHAQGGVAIAAHPVRRYWEGWDDRAIAMLDGVEIAHPVRQVVKGAATDLEAFYRRARQHDPTLAVIGSSDFHASRSLGECRTYLFARERSEAGVLDAIRAGRTVAEDSGGRLYGDPALAKLIEANRPSGRSDVHPTWRRFALVSAWVGLLGMLVLRGSTD